MTELEDFTGKYGPPQDCEKPDDAEIESYADKLPSELLELWRTAGRCSYGDRLLWFTDPKQLDDVVADWLKEFDMDEGIVFLRTAFAHIYFWANKNVYSLDVHHGSLSKVTDNFELFISLLSDDDIRERMLRVSLYEEVEKRLGPPERDECYAFVPALALGGSEEADSVQRVKLREQLGILEQLVLGS